MEVIGREGKTLGDYWAKGMRTYHGLMSHGFPNLYHMGFTQTGYTPNFTYQLDKQSQHLAKVLLDVAARGLKALEPTLRAEEDYLALVLAPTGMSKYLASCTLSVAGARPRSAQPLSLRVRRTSALGRRIESSTRCRSTRATR